MARFTNIRWKLLKSVFLSSLYTALVVFVILQVWFLIQPQLQSILVSVVTTVAIFIVSFIVDLSYRYNENRQLKKQLEDLSTYITVLARGNLSQRMRAAGDDEIASIARELNELADKIEKQVGSLQKLANEKAELAEQSRSAAAIEERQRIARDLHDAVSQQLFALSMMSSASLKLVDRDVAAAKQQMEEVADIAAKAQGEMRALLLHLRPVHLSGDSLSVGVKKLVDELEAKSDIDFELTLSELSHVPKGIEDHLFRIVQEGLANALRHSGASMIRIEFYEKGRYVYCHLRDDGIGFDIGNEKKASYGLKTMKERCEEIGGTMTVTSREGEGTALDVRVPVSEGGNYLG
ncbi:MAG TPA: sensor histidine kinase [Bacillales bacterium]|nr:sensor histidine kinase [Bacillales bacterium]